MGTDEWTSGREGRYEPIVFASVYPAPPCAERNDARGRAPLRAGPRRPRWQAGNGTRPREAPPADPPRHAHRGGTLRETWNRDGHRPWRRQSRKPGVGQDHHSCRQAISASDAHRHRRVFRQAYRVACRAGVPAPEQDRAEMFARQACPGSGTASRPPGGGRAERFRLHEPGKLGAERHPASARRARPKPLEYGLRVPSWRARGPPGGGRRTGAGPIRCGGSCR